MRMTPQHARELLPRDVLRPVPERIVSLAASVALGLALIRFAAARRAAADRDR